KSRRPHEQRWRRSPGGKAAPWTVGRMPCFASRSARGAHVVLAGVDLEEPLRHQKDNYGDDQEDRAHGSEGPKALCRDSGRQTIDARAANRERDLDVPRVAREYGQVSWARCISSTASSRGI